MNNIFGSIVSEELEWDSSRIFQRSPLETSEKVFKTYFYRLGRWCGEAFEGFGTLPPQSFYDFFRALL